MARQRTLSTFERLYLIAQLLRYDGSIKRTAQHAGVTSKHVRSLLKRNGIDPRDFRPPLRPRVSGSKAARDVQRHVEPSPEHAHPSGAR